MSRQVALVAGLLAEVEVATLLERSGRARRVIDGWEHVDLGPRPPRRSWRVGGARTL